MLAKDDEKITRLFGESVRLLEMKGYSRIEAESVVQQKLDSDHDRDFTEVRRIDDLVNKVEERRISQLITFATLLITVLGVLIAQDEVRSTFTWQQKGLALSAFFLLFCSILEGIRQSADNIDFWKKTQKMLIEGRQRVEKLIQQGKIVTFEQKTKEEFKLRAELPDSSDDGAATLQVWLLTLGSSAVMLLLILFMTGE